MAVNSPTAGATPTSFTRQRLRGAAVRRFLRNRAAFVSLLFIAAITVATIAAPVLARAHFAEQDLVRNNESPNSDFWLGSDQLGRDVYSRLVYGARISLSVAVVSQLFQLLIGVPLGLLAGYYSGLVDAVIMRIVDAMLAFPSFLLIIVLANYFRASLTPDADGLLGVLADLNETIGGLLGVFLAIGLTWWLFPARLVRGVALSIRASDYVTAARASGATGTRIIVHHILPNATAPIVVAAAVGVPAAILMEAGVSYLGLGVQPPTPSWGLMISDAVDGIRSYPYLILPPSGALVLTTLAFNFVGDGLRDALDPKSTKV